MSGTALSRGMATRLLLAVVLAPLWGLPALAQSLDTPVDAGATARSQAIPARGNPLWAIPLKALSATLDRPLFSPTRRPPPQVVTAAPPPPASPPLAGPAAPPFQLLGTLVNTSSSYALLINPATRAVVSLRTGEQLEGWILRSVSVRDAMLQKDRNTVILSLAPREGAAGTAQAVRGPRRGGAPVEIAVPKGAANVEPVDPFTGD